MSFSARFAASANYATTPYYTPKGESAESLALMRRIDELFLKHPFSTTTSMIPFGDCPTNDAARGLRDQSMWQRQHERDPVAT